MNPQQFITELRAAVRLSAIEDTIENLEEPPGRKISDVDLQNSQWFNSLQEKEQLIVKNIITSAVDEAVFGFLAVLDGVRAIEDTSEKGKLLLIYKGSKEELLNDENKEYLHDIYNESR